MSAGSERTDYSDIQISIVIANYNGWDMLKRCIESIERHTASAYELIVVDDNSQDGSPELVKKHFPDVVLIENKQNLGYTKVNNLGLAKARGDFVVLINNDVEVSESCLDLLREFLERRSDVGGAAAKLMYPDQTIQGSVKSLPTFASALFGRHSVLTKLFPGNYFSKRYLIYLDQDFSQDFKVGYASTACFMVKTSVMASVGFLDEDYVMYWVDADWCFRIKQAGHEIYCVPAASAVHHEHKGGSRSTRKASRQAIIGFNRGAYLYYRKHHIRFWWSPRNLLAIVGLSVNAGGQLFLKWLVSNANAK